MYAELRVSVRMSFKIVVKDDCINKSYEDYYLVVLFESRLWFSTEMVEHGLSEIAKSYEWKFMLKWNAYTY